MTAVRIKIADTVFDVQNIYPYAEKAAAGYITENEPDSIIAIEKETIEAKRASSPGFSPAYTEWLEIYRAICIYFEERDGIMMHGAVIGYEGNAYMFTAPSGTGKTTHIMQWKACFGDKVSIINGDKPIIRFINGQYIVYGTPWCGKERYNVNTKMPLKGIAILSRANENTISRVEPASVLPALLRQVYIHKSVRCASNAMDFIDKMFTSVPIYSLKCNISTDAANTAHNAMCVN